MKPYWTQTSLSRDFALLTAGVLFVLFVISSWVAYSTYDAYAQRIAQDLEKEAGRIDRTLTSELENANYILNALGRQIVLDKDRNLTELAQMLKSFDSKGHLYSIFSWVGPDQRIAVSSNRGVLEHPVSVADRDYVQESLADPWKMHIGKPIEGRVSERWVIPVSVGLTDYTGKFIGSIMTSIDINTLTERLHALLKRDGINFAIVSRDLIPIAQVSDDREFVTRTFPTQKLGGVETTARGFIAQGNPLFGGGSYFYYHASPNHPYILLLGYDTRHGDGMARALLLSRLMELFIIAVFFILFLWVMRTRMIHPVLRLTQAAESIARGDPYSPQSLSGPEEIRALAFQLKRISEYIEEIKRIEEELRHKVFLLKKGE